MHRFDAACRLLFRLSGALLLTVLLFALFAGDRTIFGRWWFVALWLPAAAALAVAVTGFVRRRRWPPAMLHAALLLVLAGGACTRIWAVSGELLLLPGRTVADFVTADGEVLPLPEPLRLERFRIDRYPASGLPRDYVSELRLGERTALLSVNHPLRTGPYRLIQSGFLPEGASIVQVRRDGVGRGLTLAGCLLFLLAAAGWAAAENRCKRRSLLSACAAAVLFFGLLEGLCGAVKPHTALYHWAARGLALLPFTEVFAGAALVTGFALLLRPAPEAWPSRLLRAVAAAIGWQAAGLLLRGIVAGRMPLAGASETLILLSILLPAFGLWLRGGRLLLPLTLLLGGFATLAARLLAPAPAGVEPLAPALLSSWLGIHVAVVMAAYALLLCCSTLSAIALFRPRRLDRLDRMRDEVRRLLVPALCLLGLGIFSGAVWADLSWGRYWGWDPKETWALVTWILYAAPLHPAWVGRLSPHRFHALTAGALAALLLTWAGASLLPSLHAYL